MASRRTHKENKNLGVFRSPVCLKKIEEETGKNFQQKTTIPEKSYGILLSRDFLFPNSFHTLLLSDVFFFLSVNSVAREEREEKSS